MANPFNVPKPAAASKEEAPAQAPVANAESAPAADEKKASKKPRKEYSPQLTPEQVRQIIENVQTMSYSEMCEKFNVSKAQINRTLTTARKNIKDKCEAGQITEEQRDKLLAKLSRPEDSRPGRKKGKTIEATINETTDQYVNDILSKL